MWDSHSAHSLCNASVVLEGREGKITTIVPFFAAGSFDSLSDIMAVAQNIDSLIVGHSSNTYTRLVPFICSSIGFETQLS